MVLIQNKRWVILIILILCSPFVNAKQKLTFSTGTFYLTGDYGNRSNSEIFYFPFKLKFKYEKFRFNLLVPYLKRSGPTKVILDQNQQRKEIITSSSGIGNVTASVNYQFFTHKKHKLLMDFEAKVNIGTASKTKFLGTGKTDYSFRIGVYKIFTDITPYARLGYKIFGSPNLNNVIFGSTGFSYKLSKYISAGADLSIRQRVFNKSTEKIRITAFSSQRLTAHWKIQEYVIKGLSKSTEDWGAGLSIFYYF